MPPLNNVSDSLLHSQSFSYVRYRQNGVTGRIAAQDLALQLDASHRIAAREIAQPVSAAFDICVADGV